MPVIDFNNAMNRAKNASFDPLPDGEYDLVCIEATPTEASTGKPMIRAKYQVESGPNQGKKVFNQYVFSADNDNALSFFFQHMNFHGLDGTFFAANPQWEQVAAALQGRRCRMLLGTREWNGQPRNEVKKIMPPSAGLPGAAAPAAAPAMPQVTPQPQVPQVQQPVPQQVPMQQPTPAPQPAPAPAPVPQPQVASQPQVQPQAVPPQVPQVAPAPAPVPQPQVAPQPQAPVAPQPQVQQPVEQPQVPAQPPVEQPQPSPAQDPAAPPEVPY